MLTFNDTHDMTEAELRAIIWTTKSEHIKMVAQIGLENKQLLKKNDPDQGIEYWDWRGEYTDE